MLNNIRYANIIYNISPQRNLLIPNFFPEKRINEKHSKSTNIIKSFFCKKFAIKQKSISNKQNRYKDFSKKLLSLHRNTKVAWKIRNYKNINNIKSNHNNETRKSNLEHASCFPPPSGCMGRGWTRERLSVWKSPHCSQSIFEREVFEDELPDRLRKRQTVLTN